MGKYVLKRCVIAVVTVLVLVTIIFVLVRLLPGDPFTSEKTNEAIKEKMMAYYGLDKPRIEQWFTYIKNLLKGDLGVSLKYPGRTVNSVIAQTFPFSASLGARSLILALVVGLFLGTLAAQHAGMGAGLYLRADSGNRCIHAGFYNRHAAAACVRHQAKVAACGPVDEL